MKIRKYLTVLTLLFLLFQGCKKDEPGSNEVFIKDNRFNPSSITISVGTTVTWINKERGTNAPIHTVTSDNNIFNSGDIKKRKTFSFTFNHAGTFNYHCEHHPDMKGRVLVE